MSPGRADGSSATRRRPPWTPRTVLAGLGAAAVLAGLSVAGWAAAHPEPARLPPPAAARTPSATPTPSDSLAPLPSAPDVPDSEVVHDAGPNDASIPVPVTGVQAPAGDRPVELRIPAIGVRTRLVDLGIAKDGTMQVPSDFGVAGWLTAAPAPGQRGPAVIAGHVDSHRGPAVFYRLRELVAGDEVQVVQRDGDVVTFTVRSSLHFAKDRFPTDRVYGPAPGPVLRLITCSGEIDPVSGHYVDNTVVFAS
ncbi:class F sortase [Phycicoccus sonneratiae]|uniref:Class F sortase n=1 Tax=Phycicoccus sonneratiae TaxID=2807628 RepID=A0ABS2CFY6_9MICO|nr:class F sortase [Phycicoccus sonneraticus]MBM6398780.1 class F sortase [Phycicoccus sonneraticus]